MRLDTYSWKRAIFWRGLTSIGHALEFDNEEATIFIALDEKSRCLD
jgi:hypothetical protein